MGSSGSTIQEYFDMKGGPEGYYGITVPGFPNFFILGGASLKPKWNALTVFMIDRLVLKGPNTITAHASTICIEEIQVCPLNRN